MNVLECYQIFNSLRLHFGSENYDFFKYNGKVKTSVEAFENRKDKWHYYKLSRKFDDKEQMINYIIATLVEEDKVWVGSLLEEKAEENYRKHQKVLQSLSYTFENECQNLFGKYENPNELLKTSGDYPSLLQSVLRHEISIETFIILNKILNFLPVWEKRIKDDIRWPNFRLKVIKYAAFMPSDMTKYKLLLKSITSNDN